MSEQAQPVEPETARGADSTTNVDVGATSAPGDQTGKSRAAYRDPKGSESTRDLRDTARRRRDSEEKLQQHLLEAKDHVPNEHHEHEHAHEHHEHEHANQNEHANENEHANQSEHEHHVHEEKHDEHANQRGQDQDQSGKLPGS